MNETSPRRRSAQEPDGNLPVVAAIDIGSNAIRMMIAQVVAQGQLDVLERVHRPVRMGRDTFRTGRIGARSMRAAVDILRDYQQMMNVYGVQRVRAVATSALREASNADNVLDRIFLACRFNVEVISIAEESRLTVDAVLHSIGDIEGIATGKTLIVDVGGGSTLLTVLEDGQIANSFGLRLGSVRLNEILAGERASPENAEGILRYQIRSAVESAKRALPIEECDSFVAVGGDVRFAARHVGKTKSARAPVVAHADFRKLLQKLAGMSPEKISSRFGLPMEEAETLFPALLAYDIMLTEVAADEMIVSDVSMRDGLLLELAREVTGEDDESFREGVCHAARALAERYRADMNHAEMVAQLAVKLFDEMEPDHALGSRYRLLLWVAAILHEIGGFVSLMAHHKHSYYLISNSEIFGLTRQEMELIAHVARYHRRSPPKNSHTEYVSLPRENRVIVNKLAAILRVADALARGTIKRSENVRFVRQEDELFIEVDDDTDLVLERRAMALKGDMFEDVYGMKVRLEGGVSL
ncbi:Ppx/GppA phosphatase family protein [Thermostilla marina]